MDDKGKIIVESDLRSFFFEKLNKLNSTIANPLAQETLFYSSGILDRYSKAEKFFNFEDGKVKEKLLGIKLLESQSLTKDQKRRELKDIGETSILICGYFPPSKNSKIVDSQYYMKIGRSAFEQLNEYHPSFLDVPSFFNSFAKKIENVVALINLISEDLNSNIDAYEKYSILNGEGSTKAS